MQTSIFEEIRMRENFVGLFALAHIFLNPKIFDRNIKVQRRHHAPPSWKVVKQLPLNEDVGIPNRIEPLSHGDRSSRVLANNPEASLQLRRDWILLPNRPA
jgi:hypothetical protein